MKGFSGVGTSGCLVGVAIGLVVVIRAREPGGVLVLVRGSRSDAGCSSNVTRRFELRSAQRSRLDKNPRRSRIRRLRGEAEKMSRVGGCKCQLLESC